jgi:hypothetical protein
VAEKTRNGGDAQKAFKVKLCLATGSWLLAYGIGIQDAHNKISNLADLGREIYAMTRLRQCLQLSNLLES